MKSNLLIAVLATFVLSCQPEVSDPQVLIEADSNFSKMSENQGIAKAFIHFADTNVVLLRDNPIKGKPALIDAYKDNMDFDFSLTWIPEFADIAKSGDLGYTWGKYLISAPDSLGNTMQQTGYYVSVWKRQQDGQWKYVLDGGTEPVPVE